ncbi:hypothetical protein Y032_0033g2654 [Ancylostoma ceylanicum]|uniref:Uncharacterized protein n=1 Tax=Ancylostoma ceylanicum TaxID=53326 RepID=A0A016UM06_9BILA|nr:hypothetical protein Y032_0033g2654 [Ancylostoma ceylanicum]
MSVHDPGSSSREPSAHVIDLWKRATLPPEAKPENVPITRTPISQRHAGERSWLWTNLSQMSPSDQAVMMTNLISMWPYPLEQKALNWPMHAGLLANCVSSTFIATKISSDMVVFNPKMSFLEAIRQCPKSPFVFGVYSSGIAYYVLRQIFVMPDIFNEKKPCGSCMLTRSTLIAFSSGLLLPMMATPYLCYYILLQRQNQKFPPVGNYLDFLALNWEGSRAVWPSLMKLIPFQFAVAALSTYSLLWGRDRMFNTLDADPDFARELLVSVQLKPSLKTRVMDFLRSIPYCSDIIGKPAPETERVRVN